MQINLTAEQEKALLTEYTSIEKYCRQVVENRANRIMEDIVKKHADNLEGVTPQEQAIITASLAGKIVVNAEKLPEAVKAIIVRRTKCKSMVEKIGEQDAILER